MPAVIARHLALACVVAGLAVATSAVALERDPDDEVEMSLMREHKPRAAQLVEKGEGLRGTGSLWDADAAFREAEEDDPSVALPWRRDCEVLVDLGRRGEATTACVHAVELRRANVNLRGLVHALVGGPVAPNANELFQALAITSMVRESGPGLTSTAMACDIAETIGDGIMLQHCAEDLQHLAPDAPETRHALALLASRCPPARFWAGWLAVLAAALFTMAHALSRSGLRRKARIASAAALLLAMAPSTVRADSEPAAQPTWLSKWPVDDAHPEARIPSDKERNADPLQFGYWLQDLELKAGLAHDRGDHLASARFYAAMAQAVPDRAVGFVRECEEYDAAGALEQAIEACGEALMREGTMVKDYIRFVDLVVSKQGPLSATEIAALAHVVEHMKGDPTASAFADEVECKVGTRTSNGAQLRDCTAGLAARDPDGPKTLTYEWALAIQEGRVGDAERLVERAKVAGVPVEGMARATAATQRKEQEHVALVILGVLVLLGAGAVGFRFAQRRPLAQSAA
jgi:hypothetical protein